MKWSPETRSLSCCDQKMMRKSSGWWRWIENAFGSKSNEAQRMSKTVSTTTAGRVPVRVVETAGWRRDEVAAVPNLGGVRPRHSPAGGDEHGHGRTRAALACTYASCGPRASTTGTGSRWCTRARRAPARSCCRRSSWRGHERGEEQAGGRVAGRAQARVSGVGEHGWLPLESCRISILSPNFSRKCYLTNPFFPWHIVMGKLGLYH
jgi:hypothetical protein